MGMLRLELECMMLLEVLIGLSMLLESGDESMRIVGVSRQYFRLIARVRGGILECLVRAMQCKVILARVGLGLDGLAEELMIVHVLAVGLKKKHEEQLSAI